MGLKANQNELDNTSTSLWIDSLNRYKEQYRHTVIMLYLLLTFTFIAWVLYIIEAWGDWGFFVFGNVLIGYTVLWEIQKIRGVRVVYRTITDEN